MNRLAQKKKVCALIPARLNSVRFPGKALKQIDGIPMVVRVLAAARDSGVFDAVYAATDSPEIAAVCQTYGFEAVFTSHSHQNPTSRIQEAVTILEDSKSASSRKFDFYAMIGGDEPLLTPEILQNFMEQALTVITSKENVQLPFLINAMADIPNDAETADPSNIKVVCRPDGTGLYISRAPIPFRKGTLDKPSRKFVSIGLYTRESTPSSLPSVRRRTSLRARADRAFWNRSRAWICCVSSNMGKRSYFFPSADIRFP